MAKYAVRSRSILLHALISVIVLSSAIVWTGANLSVAEDAQPDNTTAQIPTPEIFFPEPTHNFGKVYIGDKVEHIYKFINKGDANLDLIEVRSGCDCTGTHPDKWHIPPGESGELLVTFNPTETTRIGRTAKFVYVETNDPDTPRYKLKFTVQVRRDVSYSPYVLDLGIIPKGDTGVGQTVFKSKLNSDGFAITKAETYHPSVVVNYGQNNETGEWYIEASIKKNATPQKLKGNVTVSTNSAKQPKIRIQTLAEVVEEVAPFPKRVCFGKVAKGNEVSRTLTLLHAKDISIEKVKPSFKWVSADIVTADDDTSDSTTRVELKLTSVNAPDGKSEGFLRVFTNSAKRPVVKVPLCCNVLEPQT